MAITMNSSSVRCKIALILLLSFVCVGNVFAQPATLDGAVVTIPVVTAGDSTYAVDLTLIPGSDPATFDLTSAEEVPNADTTGASTFQGTTLTIPAIQVGEVNYLVNLELTNEEPIQFQLSDFSINDGVALTDAQNLFETTVAAQIIDSRCVTCHVAGGIASATGLIFERNSQNSLANNFQTLDSFTSTKSDAFSYILSKVSGGDSHGGGVQLAVGSADYNNLQSFLDVLINGSGGTVTNPNTNFFTGVSLLGPAQTLRRAAIIIAGRAPSSVEIAAVENGDENILRSSIRNLMTGDNFHDFLIEGANDRLLVRGVSDVTFLDGAGVFPNYVNTIIDLQVADLEKGYTFGFDQFRFYFGIDSGLRESPLELIAHVVENERPYSEILTADYMMMNSVAAFAMGATGDFPEPDDYADFQPVTLDRYYAWGDNIDDVVIEVVPEVAGQKIINPGSLFYDYPHAGVLNTQAYLYRYPTTATNRNRARSRWTFQHFLDTDIEASAPRTTDAVALADTNNPTLFNANCTVCHATLDPLAGAFQNYGEEGHFLVNGFDSLDDFYKNPTDGVTPYQEDDKWYRDMRDPGLFDQDAPSSDNSLQWVAQEIVQDPRFARAVVTFWWPSIIGTEILSQPEVQSDADYEAKLMAYDAQSSSIQSLADEFVSSGMNLKDLLVEMAMTQWFRTNFVDDTQISDVQAQAHALADLGSERLLSAEQLFRKTQSLTGFTWGNNINFSNNKREAGLVENYSLYYGGIDSAGVTTRSKDMTALMSTVAMTHASEASCPIVLREFALTDGTRALFNGLSFAVSPLTVGVESFTVATTVEPSLVQPATYISLDTKPKNLYVSINDGWCDWNAAAQQCDSSSRIDVQSLDIQLPDGSVTTINPTSENSTFSDDCAWYIEDDGGVSLCNASKVVFPFTPTMAGEHRLIANIWPAREGEDHPLADVVNVSLGAEATDSPYLATTTGAQEIKQKLVQLHQSLHGNTLDIASSQITMAYELFVDSWNEIRNLPNASLDYSNVNLSPNLVCKIWQDYELGVGVPIPIEPYAVQYTDFGQGPWPIVELTESMRGFLMHSGSDPQHTKRAWITVMTYMLSHYEYLYE